MTSSCIVTSQTTHLGPRWWAAPLLWSDVDSCTLRPAPEVLAGRARRPGPASRPGPEVRPDRAVRSARAVRPGPAVRCDLRWRGAWLAVDDVIAAAACYLWNRSHRAVLQFPVHHLHLGFLHEDIDQVICNYGRRNHLSATADSYSDFKDINLFLATVAIAIYIKTAESKYYKKMPFS